MFTLLLASKVVYLMRVLGDKVDMLNDQFSCTFSMIIVQYSFDVQPNVSVLYLYSVVIIYIVTFVCTVCG